MLLVARGAVFLVESCKARRELSRCLLIDRPPGRLGSKHHMHSPQLFLSTISQQITLSAPTTVDGCVEAART